MPLLTANVILWQTLSVMEESPEMPEDTTTLQSNSDGGKPRDASENHRLIGGDLLISQHLTSPRTGSRSAKITLLKVTLLQPTLLFSLSNHTHGRVVITLLTFYKSECLGWPIHYNFFFCIICLDEPECHVHFIGHKIMCM